MINKKSKPNEDVQVDIFSQIVIKEKSTGVVILKKRG